MTKPWGNIDFEFEASQYLELRDKYSLIYLPKGDATIDEILLKRRQLATTYDIGLTLGFRYTFGSIYNN
jgi:hypothetical protein